MTIKHLDAYLVVERKFVQTLPLSTLSDTRLGIDASFYLQNLLDSPSSREPLLAATGGLPLALTTRIETDLRALEKLRIKPVFIFPGLPPNKRWKGPAGSEYLDGQRDRRDAWSRYENGKEEEATRLFEGRAALSQWDLWRPVLRIFRHRNVEFLIAPYISWAQLIYLQRHPKSYIHAIFGPTDILLYSGIDKLITFLDLTAPTPSFAYVSKRNLLSDLNLTDELFLDVGILAGFEYSPTFPATLDPNFKAIVEMVKLYKSGYGAVVAFAEHPAIKNQNYLEHYGRTRSLIKYSLILSSDGIVLPLPLAIPTPGPQHHHHSHHSHNITAGDIPVDIHDIFTHRLPDEIYFYLSRGLIGPQALVWLTSGQIMENPPLDNGETTEYRRFIKEVITDGVTGPRAISLALVSSVVHSFWANRRVIPCLWFETGQRTDPPTKGLRHADSQATQLVERVGGWSVSSALIEEELRRQNSSTIDFSLCLGATSTEKLAARTKSKSASVHPLDKKDELVANVILRFLELRGFLNANHGHTPLARAMHNGLKHARVNDKFQDPLYLFLELVRAGVLHGNLWSGRAYSGGPSFGDENEKRSMLLIMRVLSIVPLSFKAQPWSAPLSRELLVFNSFLRSLSRNLRVLLEITSLNMLLRGDARRPRDDLLDVALSLPFQTDVNTGFGILAKVYLDALTHLNGRQRVTDRNAEGVKESKETALEICEETFPGVKYPKAEVERGFRFWDVALAAIRSLNSEGGVIPELADAFEAAETWLHPMRP